MAMPAPKTYLFKTAADWEAWLAEHVDLQEGIFMKIAKKAGGATSVSYGEAVEIALCYGWIDGIVHRLDERYYLQKFTPRRPRSVWSQINVAKVEALQKAGRMQPAGIAAVTAAKADGRWQAAYPAPSAMVVPTDFKNALSADPTAEAFFTTLNKTARFSILWQIETARTPETRARRIAKYVAMLKRREKVV